MNQPAATATILRPSEPGWPTQLDVMGIDTPEALWVYGTPNLTDLLGTDSVTIVGCRASTAYGERVAGSLTEGLANAHITTVTTCGYGIGNAVLGAAIATQGPHVTLGFGSPTEVTHPRALKERVAELVARGGLFVSPFPADTMPTRAGIVQIAWLAAALTSKTVVVEATARSGSKSTALAAHQYGRPLLAVPGPITNSTSWGCHDLIRTGTAQLATSHHDLMPTPMNT